MTRYGRRLSDKITDAFFMACDQNDVDAAERLFEVLDFVLTRHAGAGRPDRRIDTEFMRAAAARLDEVRSGHRAA